MKHEQEKKGKAILFLFNYARKQLLSGCSMSVEPLSLQTWTPKNTIPSLRVNKFRGRKLQETVVINSNQTVPQVECVADGIRLGILSDEKVRVTADISGRQRKQYTGILSKFIYIYIYIWSKNFIIVLFI